MSTLCMHYIQLASALLGRSLRGAARRGVPDWLVRGWMMPSESDWTRRLPTSKRAYPAPPALVPQSNSIPREVDWVRCGCCCQACRNSVCAIRHACRMPQGSETTRRSSELFPQPAFVDSTQQPRAGPEGWRPDRPSSSRMAQPNHTAQAHLRVL